MLAFVDCLICQFIIEPERIVTVFAGHFFEDAVEVREIGETGLETDVLNR